MVINALCIAITYYFNFYICTRSIWYCSPTVQHLMAFKFQVYSLTKERDTLRREQNKKSDAAALLKEKDEIITQVMAEGVKI